MGCSAASSIAGHSSLLPIRPSYDIIYENSYSRI